MMRQELKQSSSSSPQGDATNKVAVVTISETLPAHDSRMSLRCFSSEERAVQWIDAAIDEKVKRHGLTREKDVDDWLVKVDGWNHTFQYGFEVLDVE